MDSSAQRQALREQLIEHEGVELRPYRDTRGILTIGVGRNLESVGLRREEAMYLLDNDIRACVGDLARSYPWFESLDPVRQRALIDLRFNLGGKGLRAFVKFLDALSTNDVATAAKELTDSKWFTQVGRRGPRLVWMIQTGLEPLPEPEDSHEA